VLRGEIDPADGGWHLNERSCYWQQKII
jgi:hypothetical protein